MLGAIAGDIIGSRFEHAPIKSKEFALFTEQSTFTDDTVHSLALADALLNNRPYQLTLREYYSFYPNAGYGPRFVSWAESTQVDAYGSYGNGSAMRVSSVAWLFDTIEEVLAEAARSAEVTHNHHEGIRGAQAVAAAIFLARCGESKKKIQSYIQEHFSYDLTRTLDQVRPDYSFDVTCQGSVPYAIRAFIEADGFEDAVRNAVSLGGDSDTQACIAGAIAEACYGVPDAIAEQSLLRLDQRLSVVYKQFCTAVKG